MTRLLAVTTGLPRSRASAISARAGSSPPISSTTTSTSSAATTSRASVVSCAPPSGRGRVWLLEAPVGFARRLDPLPAEAGVTTVTPRVMQDVIVLFAMSHVVLVELLHRASHHLAPRGGLWAAWPRKSSGVFTDLTEE